MTDTDTRLRCGLRGRLDAIARMLEALDRKGDAEALLSRDSRRLLTHACILLRREVDALDTPGYSTTGRDR